MTGRVLCPFVGKERGGDMTTGLQLYVQVICTQRGSTTPAALDVPRPLAVNDGACMNAGTFATVAGEDGDTTARVPERGEGTQ